MLKIQQIIYKTILIYFLSLSVSQADLIKPNYSIEPYQVVKIQLKSLQKNNSPNLDSGIEQTWEFAHPSNKKNTGPLDRFKVMLKGKSYKILLDHLDHEIIQEKLTNSIAIFEVKVLGEDKSYYKFKWQVEKYKKEGPLMDCWLTTMVSAPMPLGSSI
ncbi:hypothetical protein OAN08_04260 [Candidatus Pelagibacter sp.]|jgi:hypothetical protein|nr:hypothetical protein [Candidatus Pelagibacter sp.]|tara:strand:- start:299 stop:772 length:474 start_codon:yes stop_codon:yes gene_type:complete